MISFTSGIASISIISQESIPSDTSVAIMVAVIALVHEPRWTRSFSVKEIAVPIFLTPADVISTMPVSDMIAALMPVIFPSLTRLSSAIVIVSPLFLAV